MAQAKPRLSTLAKVDIEGVDTGVIARQESGQGAIWNHPKETDTVDAAAKQCFERRGKFSFVAA